MIFQLTPRPPPTPLAQLRGRISKIALMAPVDVPSGLCMQDYSSLAYPMWAVGGGWSKMGGASFSKLGESVDFRSGKWSDESKQFCHRFSGKYNGSQGKWNGSQGKWNEQWTVKAGSLVVNVTQKFTSRCDTYLYRVRSCYSVNNTPSLTHCNTQKDHLS